jgi:two-component sensor histidine kinase
MFDLLYQSDSVSKIMTDQYLHKVISSIPPNSIKIKYNLEEVEMATKPATSLGIIANELVTNAVKYAFPGKEKGAILISLKKSATGATLDISDNGKGLPDGFDISKTDSLGLKLVTTLSKQMEGTFKIETNNGTKCTLEFPIREIN